MKGHKLLTLSAFGKCQAKRNPVQIHFGRKEDRQDGCAGRIHHRKQYHWTYICYLSVLLPSVFIYISTLYGRLMSVPAFVADGLLVFLSIFCYNIVIIRFFFDNICVCKCNFCCCLNQHCFTVRTQFSVYIIRRCTFYGIP